MTKKVMVLVQTQQVKMNQETIPVNLIMMKNYQW